MNDIFDFVMNNWQLCAALVVVLGGYLVFEYMQSNNSDSITPDQAIALINHEHGVVIDVRTPAEFSTGHILHAINVDSNEPDEKFKKLNKYTKKPVILVCAHGKRSAQCLERMRKQGFERIFSLEGGLQTWKNAGLPLVNK